MQVRVLSTAHIRLTRRIKYEGHNHSGLKILNYGLMANCPEWIILNKTGIIADNIQHMKNYCGFIEVYIMGGGVAHNSPFYLPMKYLDNALEITHLIGWKTVAVFKIKMK